MNNYSKGMKRQVFISLALAIKPKYLLLDEAFDGLDPIARLTVKREIIDLVTLNNTTVIISSHNLKELEDICDTFAILENNHIETSGSIADTKDTIHKVQVAFKQEKNKEDFIGLDIMHFSKLGRIITLVVQGDLESTKEIINSMNPLMIDILPVNLEEIFIYEMERKGVFINE